MDDKKETTTVNHQNLAAKLLAGIFMVTVIFLIIYVLFRYSTENKKSKPLDNDSLFNDDFDISSNVEYGSFGSRPSNKIESFDSFHKIELPELTDINSFLDEFKDLATGVFADWEVNRNSTNYKNYIYHDYKIQLLIEDNLLSPSQLTTYYSIMNRQVYSIEKLFKKYLDQIKLDESRAYYYLYNSFVNEDSTGLLIDIHDFNSIVAFASKKSDIYKRVLSIIKQKVSFDTNNMIDRLITVAGTDNYRIVKALKEIMHTEPQQAITFLGITNEKVVNNIDGTVKLGFWSELYRKMKRDHIDHRLIDLIEYGLYTERFRFMILYYLESIIQRSIYGQAVDALYYLCKNSKFFIIRDYPYYVIYNLVLDVMSDIVTAVSQGTLVKYNSTMFDNMLDESITQSNVEKHTALINKLPMYVVEIKQETYDNVKNINIAIDPGVQVIKENSIIAGYVDIPTKPISGVTFKKGDTNRMEALYIANNNTQLDIEIDHIYIYAKKYDTLPDDIATDVALSNDFLLKYDPSNSKDNDLSSKNIIDLHVMTINKSAANHNESTYTATNNKFNDSWRENKKISLPAGQAISITPSSTNIEDGTYVRVYGIMIAYNRLSFNNLVVSTINGTPNKHIKTSFQIDSNTQDDEMKYKNLLLTFYTTYGTSPFSVLPSIYPGGKIITDRFEDYKLNEIETLAFARY